MPDVEILLGSRQILTGVEEVQRDFGVEVQAQPIDLFSARLPI